VTGPDSDSECLSGSSIVTFGRVIGSVGLYLPWALSPAAAHAAAASSPAALPPQPSAEEPADTDDTPAGDGNELSQVTVSGVRTLLHDKLAESEQNAPQSITVVTGRLMADQGTTGLEDALRNVPGITLNSMQQTSSAPPRKRTFEFHPVCVSWWLAAAVCGTLAFSGSVLAAPPSIAVPFTQQEQNGEPTELSTFVAQLRRSNYLLGDLFGARTFLSRYGISFVAQETSEVLGNTTGGSRTGAEYDGLTQLVLQLDTQRAFGLYGGLFNISALQIHGDNLSASNLQTLQTASGIEADRATRLWEMWYDQKFLPEDRLDVRVGLESADQEFIDSNNAAYFVNTMFGWPALPSYDLPGGGPAYPLSAPAVRIRIRPVNAINLLVGVFNGSPVNDNTGDPQQQNPSGTTFPLHGGTFAITELQIVSPALGSMVYAGQTPPLARLIRIGAWYDSESFADEHYDANGLSLANPASNGVPASHHGDYSLYAVADQMLWRDGEDPNRNLNAFARVMGAPQSDRNLIAFSMNAGLVYHDPYANRPDDTVGLGMGYVRVSQQVSAYEQDLAAYAARTGFGAFYPVQGSETYFELTYQRQMRPWWQIQPDIQYVFNPGAGVVDPSAPTHTIRNEFVVGIRTNILL
jgi:porin